MNSLFVTTNKEKKLLSNTYVDTNKIIKKNVGYGILKPKYNKEIVKKIFYSKYPDLKNKNFLIFLGRFHEKKGCDTLLKSLHLLKSKNIKINLFLAGPDNDYKNKLYHISKKLNLQNQIFWSDNIKGKLKWGALYSSDGMVLSSNGENFGVSLAESLSCGKPVLTTYKVFVVTR